MSQTHEKLVPKLRFSEFEGDWPLVEFKKCFYPIKKRPSKSEKLPLFSLTIESGVVPKTDRYERSFLVKNEEEAYKVVEKDNFVYNPMNLRFGALAKHNQNDAVLVSKYYDVFACRENYYPDFFASYLLTNRMVIFYNRMATGSLVEKQRVHFADFLKFKKPVPKLQEQQKIASFFSAVGEKISQLHRKKELLETYKKGCMQQIFSQQIRFTDEDGKLFPSLKEKSLGSMGNFTGGGTPDTTREEYWNGGTAWVSSSDLSDDHIRDIKINRRITQKAIETSATQLTPKGAVLIVTRVGIGKCAISPEEVCTSQDFTNFIPKEGVAVFFAYWLSHNQYRLKSLAQGTSIKGITTHDLKALKILVPHQQEQQKIADFLSSIDTKIDLVSKELSSAKSFKKGLLQQMFV